RIVKAARSLCPKYRTPTPCVSRSPRWSRSSPTRPSIADTAWGVRVGARRTLHDQQPASPFGPRLMALVVLLTGVYHLSRRKAAELLSDMAGVRISVGAVSAVEARVSAAVEPAVEAAWDRVHQAEVKHTDGTSWFQSGLSRALWTIATAAATVFKIVTDGSKKTLEPLYGALQGILVSDRATARNSWAM